jgi:flagellar biosynthesis anti-sigma factor FlgM
MDGIDKAGGASDLARLRPSSSASSGTPVSGSTPVAATPAVKADVKAPSQGTDLISLLAEGAPIDTKKVEAIQSLIQAGAYPIDPRAIAAKMIALDFPGSKD